MMKDNETAKISERRAVVRFADFVVKYAYETDWTLLAIAFGLEEVIDDAKHDRLRGSQGFGDDDYPHCVARFLQEIFDADKNLAMNLMSDIIEKQGELPVEAVEELKKISELITGKRISTNAGSIFGQENREKEFVQVEGLPDDFYKPLLIEINLAFRKGMVISLAVLVRKLFENLIIDILRKKYGTRELVLYYDPSRRRFQEFSVVLENFRKKKEDFLHITDKVDMVINDIQEYRETGNANAHSIDVKTDASYFVNKQETIQFDLLVRLTIYNNL